MRGSKTKHHLIQVVVHTKKKRQVKRVYSIQTKYKQLKEQTTNYGNDVRNCTTTKKNNGTTFFSNVFHFQFDSCDQKSKHSRWFFHPHSPCTVIRCHRYWQHCCCVGYWNRSTAALSAPPGVHTVLSKTITETKTIPYLPNIHSHLFRVSQMHHQERLESVTPEQKQVKVNIRTF